MKLNGILETCLYAEDLGAAEAFYNRLPGLKLFQKSDGRHLFYRCGEQFFFIFNPAATIGGHPAVPAHGARGPGHVAFAVKKTELEKWRHFLQTGGIEIEAEVEWPAGGHSIYFRDPAGNCLELAPPEIWPEVKK